MMYFALILLVAALGASIGSYIAARTYRIIHHMSLAPTERSRCPHCKHQLTWQDLIPLLSYLNNRTRCRWCNEKISAHYFWIELLCALLFVTSLLLPQIRLEETSFYIYILSLVPFWIGWSVLFYCSVLDFKLKGFPVVGLTISSIIIGSMIYVKGMLEGTNLFIDALIGGIAYALLLLCIKIFGGLLYKQEVMGEGDIYLGGCIGILLGFQGSIMAFYCTALIGGVVGLFYLYQHHSHETNTLPFGPLLSIGALCSAFFGEHLIQWYITYIG